MRRAGWSAADQIVSSLSNVAVMIVAARALDAAQFGAFSVGYMTYVLVMGSSRAVASEPAAAAYTTAPPDELRRAWAGALAVATLVGAVAAIPTAAVGFALGGPLRGALGAVAICLPGLLLQDALRYMFTAQGEPSQALVNDVVWGVLQVGGLIVATTVVDPTVGSVVLGWGLAGSAAALIGLVQARLWPALGEAGRWARDLWRLGRPFLGDFVLLIAATQLTQYAVGAVAGLAALGALRAANVIIRPPATLVAASRLFLVPEMARLRARPESLSRFAVAVAAALFGGVVAWGAVAQFIPDPIGEELLGDSWATAEELLLPLAVALAFTAAAVPALSALRALELGAPIVRARAVGASAQLGGGVLGAIVDGAFGAAIGLAVGNAVGATAFWVTCRRALAAPPRLGPTSSPEGAPAEADAVPLDLEPAAGPAAPDHEPPADAPAARPPGSTRYGLSIRGPRRHGAGAVNEPFPLVRVALSLIIAGLVAGAVFYVAQQQDAPIRATTTVVVGDEGDNVFENAQAVEDLRGVLFSGALHRGVADELGVEVDEVAGNINSDQNSESRLVNLSYVHPDAETAREGMTAIVDVANRLLRQTVTEESELEVEARAEAATAARAEFEDALTELGVEPQTTLNRLAGELGTLRVQRERIRTEGGDIAPIETEIADVEAQLADLSARAVPVDELRQTRDRLARELDDAEVGLAELELGRPSARILGGGEPDLAGQISTTTADLRAAAAAGGVTLVVLLGGFLLRDQFLGARRRRSQRRRGPQFDDRDVNGEDGGDAASGAASQAARSKRALEV